MAFVLLSVLLKGMTTIVEKDSSGLATVLDCPSSKGGRALCDCVTGGYSVWNCPPIGESKIPAPARKAPSLLTDWKLAV